MSSRFEHSCRVIVAMLAMMCACRDSQSANAPSQTATNAPSGVFEQPSDPTVHISSTSVTRLHPSVALNSGIPNVNSGRENEHAEGPHTHKPSGSPAWQTAHVLRVCADPNNMPFSNQQQQGFENKLASLIAHDIGARLTYLWFPQRRGFIKHTLRAKDCDIVMGVPVGFDMAKPTQPYYKSTYVFVTRRDRGIHVTSLNDTVLHHVKIGVHIVGDDYSNPPAVQALAQRGIVSNVVGYSIYGDYSKPDPPAELVRAVARGDVDVAIVWGPFAGYFAQHSRVPLTITPLPASDATPALPFTFSIAAASRYGDSTTYAMLERELTQHHNDIQQLLHQYGVPLVALPSAAQESRS